MDIDWPPVLGFGSAVLTAVVTVIGTVWVAKTRTKVDIGASITAGFKELTDQLQEERHQLSDIIHKQRLELAEAADTNSKLEAELRRLRRQVAILEQNLDKRDESNNSIGL